MTSVRTSFVRALAFQLRLKLVDATTGEEYLPVYWDDNYIALMPGETRDVKVEYVAPASGSAALDLEAWNVAATRVTSGGR